MGTSVEGRDKDGSADSGRPPVKIAGKDGAGNVQTLLVGTDGSSAVVGSVAAGATDSGNPVKIAGKYNSTQPTLTDGQRGDFQVDSRANARVTLFKADTGSNIGALTLDSDATAAANLGLFTQAFATLFNGTSWDRQRGTVAAALLASASRTTTQTSADITNYNHRGIKVIVDMTAVGTGSVTMKIEGKAAVGTYYTILSGAAITTNSTNVYTVFPAATVTANVSANDALPRTFRIVVTANNGNAATYSVDYELVL